MHHAHACKHANKDSEPVLVLLKFIGVYKSFPASEHVDGDSVVSEINEQYSLRNKNNSSGKFELCVWANSTCSYGDVGDAVQETDNCAWVYGVHEYHTPEETDRKHVVQIHFPEISTALSKD